VTDAENDLPRTQQSPEASHAPASSQGHCHMTIIFPFDIGRSYVFYAKPEQWHPSPEEAEKYRLLGTKGKLLFIWGNMIERRRSGQSAGGVAGEGGVRRAWDASQLSDRFSTPLGFRAHLVPSVEEEPMIKVAVTEMPWLDAGAATVEISVFPLGIGVLVLSAPLVVPASEACKLYWENRSRIQDMFGGFVNEMAREVKKMFDEEAVKPSLLELEGGSKCVLYELTDIRRDKKIDVAGYSFPIIFESADCEFEKLLNVNAKSGAENFQFECKGEVISLRTGWSAACVLKASSIARHALEDAFSIAMISWYALVVMDKMASEYLIEAFKDLAVGRSRILKQKSQTMRLTFMDAASTARPIRWATEEPDIALLELIHKTWISERMLKQVEEQTRMLVTHHQQLEAEERERNNSVIACFGVLLASFAFTGALKDELELLPITCPLKELIRDDGWWLSIVFLVICAVFLISVLKRRNVFVQ